MRSLLTSVRAALRRTADAFTRRNAQPSQPVASSVLSANYRPATRAELAEFFARAAAIESPKERAARIARRVAAVCPNTAAASLAPFRSHSERKRARRAHVSAKRAQPSPLLLALVSRVACPFATRTVSPAEPVEFFRALRASVGI